MAARKSRQPPADDGSQQQTADSPAVAPNGGEDGESRLLPAAAIFATWFAALAGLAVWTANPVTLNQDQLLRADLIVEATVTDLSAGECNVLTSWPAGAQGESVKMTGLHELPVTPGERYLFALQRDPHGNGYSVVRSAPPEAARLIYPATDAARSQLADILDHP